MQLCFFPLMPVFLNCTRNTVVHVLLLDTKLLLQAELKAVNDKVEALEAQCAATVGEKKRLADEAETTANRLVRAEKLTSGLASEGVRWLESLENLGKQKVSAAMYALG